MMKLRWWRVDASEVAAVTAMGVWEAVLAGGGRRFIKRKDSDAGETGRYRRPLPPPPFICMRGCSSVPFVPVFLVQNQKSGQGDSPGRGELLPFCCEISADFGAGERHDSCALSRFVGRHFPGNGKAVAGCLLLGMPAPFGSFSGAGLQGIIAKV